MNKPLEIEVTYQGNIARVRLRGRLDTPGVDRIEAKFTSAVVPEGRNTVVDLSEGATSRFSLMSLTAAIRKNWIIIAALTASVALAVTFYTLGQTKIYEAEATVLFDPQPPRPLGKPHRPPNRR